LKKLLTFIFLGCLVFGLAAAASAETAIYLDAVGSGSYNVTDKHTNYESGVIEAIHKYKFDGDLSGFILGSESSFAKFKIGLEYGKIDTNDYKAKIDGVTLDGQKLNNSFTLAEVKWGYRVIDRERLKIDLIAAVLDLNSDDEMKVTAYNTTCTSKSNRGGNMLGADFVINFSKSASLQGTLATSLLGANYSDFYSDSSEANYGDDLSLMEIKLKFNYFITDKWAAALGYRLYKFSGVWKDGDYDGAALNSKLDADGSIEIFTVGAVYKF
jgi:hypothetical protein